MECLKRSIIQLDILEVGQTYRVITNEGRYSRDMELELVGCYKDHYSFKDSLGRKESFLKTDLFSGVWEIKGFNPRERLLTAAGKMQEAMEVKREVDTQSEIEEEVERIVRENVAKMVGEVTRWLNENPNQEGDVREIISEFDPSQYYIDKVRDTVVKHMKKQGQEIVVTDGRPKKLILKVDEQLVEVEEVEEAEEAEELHPMAAELIGVEVDEEVELTENLEPEAIREYKMHKVRGENTDRKFLIEKAEELQLRITDSQERLDQLQTRLTAEIDIYQELLEEIQEHLEA
jgi:hypothetical protein